MAKRNYLIDVLIFASVFIHLYICPYSKVEESFNMQATHDLLFFDSAGNETMKQYFDHFAFPGVVPRSFLGPAILSSMTAPIQRLLFGSSTLLKENAIHTAEHIQFLCRLFLGFLCVVANAYFRRSIREIFGNSTATIYGLFVALQFHLPFYMSRMLPNTFALCLVLLSYGLWLKQKHGKMFILLGMALVFFRGELLILVASIAIFECVIVPRYSFFKGLSIGVASVLVCIVWSFLFDSLFWQRLVWPEGEVLYFNTVMNKSHEWGTQPFLWYFVNAIPRSMLSGVLFIPFVFFNFNTLKTIWRYMLSAIVFVFIYSFLPHKELRFIFYAIPLLNMVAAYQLDNTIAAVKSTMVKLVLLAIVYGSMIFMCVAFLSASSKNYYGALAIKQFHTTISTARVKDQKHRISVHIDGEAAMNGVTRFLQDHGSKMNITYSKEERPESADFSDFDYIITSKSPKSRNLAPFFHVVHVEEGFSRFNWRNLKIETEPKLYVMERLRIEHTDENESYRPILKWAQRSEKVLITAEMYDIESANFICDIRNYSLLLQANSKSKKYYVFLPLFDELDPKASKCSVGNRWVKIELVKIIPRFWPRLTCFKEQLSYIKVDWDNWMEPTDVIVESPEAKKSKSYSFGHGSTSRFIERILPLPDTVKHSYLQLIGKKPFILALVFASSIFVVVTLILYEKTSMKSQKEKMQ